jgi:hypothetical protein
MSAFIVSDTTMHRAVYIIAKHARSFMGVTLAQSAQTIGDDLKAMDEIGRKLFELNERAVAGRYHKTPDLTAHAGYIWQSSEIPLRNEIACYKALECLLYQCSEDPVHDSPEWRELDTMCGNVARRIVANLPEYDAAPWGGSV